MKSHFFAYISRMRFIQRWALMRNTAPENVQEHSHQVAVLAHALAVIRNERFGGRVDAGAVAAAALYQKGMARLAPGSPQALLSQYLTDHLAENLSSEAICKALSLSRTGLYHLSCQTYGCGVKEQLTRMRVQKAMDLLATTTLSHWEICQQTGFGDYNYFYRVFRSQTGLTPRQYRISTISEEPEKV